MFVTRFNCQLKDEQCKKEKKRKEKDATSLCKTLDDVVFVKR